MWERIKYAFQIAPSEPIREDDQALLQRVAHSICKRGMAAPAILALESARPMGFLGSQALVALQPLMELFVRQEEYERFTALLERRDGIESLIACMEQWESEHSNEK